MPFLMTIAARPREFAFRTTRPQPGRVSPLILLLFILSGETSLFGQPADRVELNTTTRALKTLSPVVFPDAQRADAAAMVPNWLHTGLSAASRKSTTRWHAIQDRADWERFRDQELHSLRAAIGPFPESRCRLRLHVVSTVECDEFVIRNLVFQSRPGLWVTANLYEPSAPRPSMPGLLICHAHHTPKEHSELQDR